MQWRREKAQRWDGGVCRIDEQVRAVALFWMERDLRGISEDVEG